MKILLPEPVKLVDCAEWHRTNGDAKPKSDGRCITCWCFRKLQERARG